ncbi:MAG: energy-coupling factor ABC transporter ATP-binding protein [Thermoleophilia bacterium]|nr:energy-coupling factor ABC transporter ATP-binding protein [Thermoleophilia bacterium]
MTAIVTYDLRFRYTADAPWSVDGANLQVEPGEIVLLEGESGSGKSTLLRVLAGLAPAFHGGEAAGEGLIAGVNLRTAQPAEIAQRAGFLFQDPETQVVMAEPLRDVAFSLQCHGAPAETILASARTALERINADHLIGRRIDQLSAGERQRVALAAVLAPEPAVLLLDEPTAQLDDDTACELVGELRRLADLGLAIVIAEHRHDRVGHLTDRVIGLHHGSLVSTKAAVPLMPLAPAPTPSGPPRVTLDNIAAKRGERAVVTNATASLQPGQIAALLGVNGGGKSTLLRTLAGLEPMAGGRLLVGTRDLTTDGAESRVPLVAFVPQDPSRTLLCDTVRDEILLGPRTLGCDLAVAEQMLAALDLNHLADRNPRDCSVGERERVAIAAAFALSPQLVLLDEPTRGMDLAHRATLVLLLREHASRGGCAIVATHDLDLARACADRRWLLADGHLQTAEEMP